MPDGVAGMPGGGSGVPGGTGGLVVTSGDTDLCSPETWPHGIEGPAWHLVEMTFGLSLLG